VKGYGLILKGTRVEQGYNDVLPVECSFGTSPENNAEICRRVRQ
jgi:hypothetical protein